jgi:hypothetical protein
VLFNLVGEYGVPLGQDGKANWSELKDKMKNNIKEFSKTPSQV